MLNEAQEHTLIHWIISLDNANALPTPTIIEQYANQILYQNRNTQVISKMWIYYFIKCLPPHF